MLSMRFGAASFCRWFSPILDSGTCARKEGLRTLTSPRREASLFKLGRNFGSGHFLVSSFICCLLTIEISARVRDACEPEGRRLNSKFRPARSGWASPRWGGSAQQCQKENDMKDGYRFVDCDMHIM